MQTEHTVNSIVTLADNASYEDTIISNEEKVKIVLNNLIDQAPILNNTDWVKIFDEMGVSKTLGSTNSSSVYQRVYKNAIIRLVSSLAQKQDFQIAKDGNSLYVFDNQFWIEVETTIIKHFFRAIAVKSGVPLWIAEDVVFIDSLYKQFEVSGFFEPMKYQNTTLLNLQNGTLHIGLDGVFLEDFHRFDFLKHQLDFEYNPSAVNTLWLDFLDVVLPDKDTQKTLQQALGYLFIKDLKLEKAVFLYGTGSNGKSVIFEVLSGILCSEMITNYSLSSLTSTAGYHRTGLNGRLINYGTDISMKQMDHGLFKQLVSGEPVEVRQIYEKPFIMKDYAKLIFNLNKIDDADVESTIGFFRRMIFIPFEVTIKPEEQDKTLHKKILKNKAGVLNWIIEGLVEVITNQEIFISQQCSNFLENFKKESNLAIRFIEDRRFATSPTNTIGFQAMYDLFKNFCFQNGERAYTQRQFNNELKKLEFQYTRRSSGNVWFASTTEDVD